MTDEPEPFTYHPIVSRAGALLLLYDPARALVELPRRRGAVWIDLSRTEASGWWHEYRDLASGRLLARYHPKREIVQVRRSGRTFNIYLETGRVRVVQQRRLAGSTSEREAS